MLADLLREFRDPLVESRHGLRRSGGGSAGQKQVVARGLCVCMHVDT
jgi:hypothetical protein